MNKEELMASINKSSLEMKEALKIVRDKQKGELSASCKQIFSGVFQLYPHVENFSWPQYAPYFNDGEPCEFSVHSDPEDIEINGASFEDSGNDSIDKEKARGFSPAYEISSIKRDRRDYSSPYPHREIKGRPLTPEEGEALEYLEQLEASTSEPYNTISGFISNLAGDEKLFEWILGEDGRVVVHKDGRIEMEEYPHD